MNTEWKFWSSRKEKRQVLTVAGGMLALALFLTWWNDPNKSPEKIRKELTGRYNGDKAAYADISTHCRDFMDTCGCGEYQLDLSIRGSFWQQCNIYWREDKQNGYFNDRQEDILKDFMTKQHISEILLYPDSILFIYGDMSHRGEPVRLTITKHPAPPTNRLDTYAYYFWQKDTSP